MKCNQYRWSEAQGWEPELPLENGSQWILLFASRENLKNWSHLWNEIHKSFPKAELTGCTTAGEIFDTMVSDDYVVITSIEFNSSEIHIAQISLDNNNDSHMLGEQLLNQFPSKQMKHLFVLSEGLNINGSQLAASLRDSVSDDVAVTGGLAGDGEKFSETWLIRNKDILPNHVIGIAFYGENLQIGFGSLGGLDPFGVQRLVTRSDGNILYELDGQSALELYRNYLGEHASKLPASGLLFPLSIKVNEDSPELVRTLLGVDNQNGGLIFAGDIPENSMAQLMKANFDRLVDGASQAAQNSQIHLGKDRCDLAILISCIGRRLVLKQRIEEETEEVKDVLGEQITMTGFYSYGEICPVKDSFQCELHNQTMTITTLCEKDSWCRNFILFCSGR